MARTPNTGLADADIYFNIEDGILRDVIRQVFDNTRLLNNEISILRNRVRDLEDREDKEGLM